MGNHQEERKDFKIVVVATSSPPSNFKTTCSRKQSCRNVEPSTCYTNYRDTKGKSRMGSNEVISNQDEHVPLSFRKRCMSGWKFGVFAGTAASTLVLLINIIAVIYVGSKSAFKESRGILYEGSCSTTRNANIALHVIINGLATVLLSASNYTMQILSAPTRKDVDEMHRKSVWMDIGVSSFRNLSKISGKRLALWLLLALSSVPLHLL